MQKFIKTAGKVSKRNLSTAQNAFQHGFTLAKVFTLIIAIFFMDMAYGQTVFNDPVGINTSPAGGFDFHVNGQIRFQALSTSTGVTNFLSINPANGDIRRQAGRLLPLSGGSTGETLYWDGSAWVSSGVSLTNNGSFVGVQTATVVPPVGMNYMGPVGGGGTPPWQPVGAFTPVVHFSVANDVSIGGDYYGANIYISSDERIKENINILSDWKKVFDVQAYSYKFIGQRREGLSYGFLAQDVNKVLPELTSICEGVGTVNYLGFIPFLSQGLKEHEERLSQIESGNTLSNVFAQEIGSLQEANRELKDQNMLLQQRLELLEQGLNNICNMPCLQGDNPKPVDRTNSKTIELNDPPALFQNEPNPFTSLTHIRYYLPEGSGNGKMLIRNSEGKTVGDYPITQSGHGSISIQPATLAPGTYFYSLMINGREHETKKMTLINN